MENLETREIHVQNVNKNRNSEECNQNVENDENTSFVSTNTKFAKETLNDSFQIKSKSINYCNNKMELDRKNEIECSQKNINHEKEDLNKHSTVEYVSELNQFKNIVMEKLDDFGELPEFVGFDSTTVEQSSQIFEILREKVHLIQDVSMQENSGNSFENTTKANNLLFNNQDTVIETSQGKIPDDELMPTSTKRLKRKRKFFDEFEDKNDLLKKQCLMKKNDETAAVNISFENKENFISDDKIQEELFSENSSGTSASMCTETLINSHVKNTEKSDISDASFEEPFKYGWKREIMYRNTHNDDSKKSNIDVTYISPQGKKLKNIRQISKHISFDNELKIKHFSFSSKLIFPCKDSDYEIISYSKNVKEELNANKTNQPRKFVKEVVVSLKEDRNEKFDIIPNKSKLPLQMSLEKTVRNECESDDENEVQKSVATLEKINPVTKTNIEQNVTDVIKLEYEESINSNNVTKTKITTPKVVLRGINIGVNSVPKSINFKSATAKIRNPSNKTVNNKKNTAVKKKKVQKSRKNFKTHIKVNKKNKSEPKSLSNSESVLYNVSSNAKSTCSLREYSSTISFPSKDNRGMSVCSKNCPPAIGIVPSLQCVVCLCLFHLQCCGFDSDHSVKNFVCKNCRLIEKKTESTQPLSKENEKNTLEFSNSSSFCLNDNRLVVNSMPGNSQETAKIVDGVTTLLPSSSSIRLCSNAMKNTSFATIESLPSTLLSDTQMSHIQSIIEFDNKRYIIVPKQSVLSISSNVNDAINTFTESKKALKDVQRDRLIGSSSVNSKTSINDANTSSSPTSFVFPQNDIVKTVFINPSDVNSTNILLVPVISSSANVEINSQNLGYRAPLFVNNTVQSANLRNNNDRILPVELSNTSYGANAFSVVRNEETFKENATRKMNSNFVLEPATSNLKRLSEYKSVVNLSSMSYLYESLILSLKYLTVRELLRVTMTNKFFNRIGSDPVLWKTVRLKNSKIYNWKGFARALQKYGTKRLDMRKMLCSTSSNDKMWFEFLEVIPTITSLEHIDFFRCFPSVIDTVAKTCPNLSVINAVYLKNDPLPMENLTKLSSLKELRLKGMSDIVFRKNNNELQFVNKDILQVLSLTNLINLDMNTLEIISEAQNLVALELGECTTLPADFASTTLTKLSKLQKLRLEKVENLAPTYSIFTVIQKLENLKYLELINFEVKQGFDNALAACKNLDELLIIPTYVTQSAATNQLIINGIGRLSETIKCFVWGLTLELLRVTDLFMNQYQIPKENGDFDPDKKEIGEIIPIIKSKIHLDGEIVPTQVDILPIPKLEKMLNTLLPNSYVKILKIPFGSTWRQSLSDCCKHKQ